MNCEEVQRRLSEYFENLSDPVSTASIGDHLSDCAHCRAEAEALAHTVQLIRALPEVEPPVGFATRVMAHVKESATKPRFWQQFFFPFHIKLPIHAAAVVLVSVLAAYVYHKEPQQRQIQIGEAESDRLGTDKREVAPAPEFRPHVPTTETKEELQERQAPKVTASAPPPVSTGQLAERKEDAVPPYRPDATPLAPEKSSQGKSSVPGEIAGGRDLLGSELGDPRGTIPAPPEGSRDARSSVGAAPPGARTKNEATTPTTERENMSKDALDRLAAPQRGLTPRSPRTREVPADYELFIRLRSAASETKTSSEALASRQPENARPSVLSPAQKLDLDNARQRATDTEQAQTLWLSISRDQWTQFKIDLASFAQIEVESAAPAQAKEAISKSAAPLRVKVTILPPLSAPSAPGPR